jgi:hypothetical protein
MAVHERQNSAVHQTRMKQRGSRGKPEVATISLARGVVGGDRRVRTRTEREQSNAGEFPKTLTPSASVHPYHAYRSLNSNIQLSWSLAQQFLFETFSCFKLKPISHAFLSFFSCCTTLEYFFSIFKFNYLHRNLTNEY